MWWELCLWSNTDSLCFTSRYNFLQGSKTQRNTRSVTAAYSRLLRGVVMQTPTELNLQIQTNDDQTPSVKCFPYAKCILDSGFSIWNLYRWVTSGPVSLQLTGRIQLTFVMIRLAYWSSRNQINEAIMLQNHEIIQIPCGVYVNGKILQWERGAGCSFAWLEEDGESGSCETFTVVGKWTTSPFSSQSLEEFDKRYFWCHYTFQLSFRV